MGTGGLWAYRYRRRYFTKYNQSRSYLEGLGAGLVDEIPQDPVELKKWVEALKQELEQRYQDWKQGMEVSKSAKDNSRLRPPECPFSMRAPTLDLFIAYTYVIDLDRSVFTVNEVAHFPLDAFPRGAWMEAVYDPTHPARIATPAPTVPPPDPRHLRLYETSGAIHDPGPLPGDEPSAFTTCGALMDYFFRQLRFVYSPVLDCVDQYEHTHPDFRALVEAVLALATWGRFHMRREEFEPGDDRLVTSVGPGWANLERDNAETHLWHCSTLVVLDVGLEDEQRLRAAVGRAVDLWRSSSRPVKHSSAFIISLKSVVVARLSDSAVEHSAPVALCGAATESQPPFARSPHTPGFAMLRRHFTPELPAANVCADLPLPLDVLERVLDMCGKATLAAVAQTCKAMRTMYLMRPRFTVGKYRLVYHTADSGFTAFDESGVVIPVVVGKLGCAVKTDLPGGPGHNLVLSIADHDYLVRLMGLRCVPKELGGADAGRLVETPETDWRVKRIKRLQ